jgi:predicted nucleotide-binding protein (sugar kinase/HSP70/actin superfamily)
MTSRVRHAQKEGVSVADIAAGLAYSVVRNALYKVIGCSDPSLLGSHVVVQGGTFKSEAVLRAFELESGLDVTRPDIAELMGAYGAALLARDECDGRAGTSSLLNSLELASLRQSQNTRHCQGCTNNCLLTINSFSPSGSAEGVRGTALTERTLITGNRCERIGVLGRHEQGLPNLFKYEQQLLSSYDEDAVVSAITVGIPGVLDLYETYPFWKTFFSQLGMRVIRAHHSNSDLYQKGAHAVMSEGVCYPAKLTHGHVTQLIEQGADVLFMPTGGAVASAQAGVFEAGRCRTIECPVSSGYARLIAEDIAESQSQTCFMTCDLASPVPLAQQFAKVFVQRGIPELSFFDEGEIQHALAVAASEQEAFYERLAARTAEVLALLEKEDLRAVALAGHPYHVDPGINHGVDSLLVDLGFPVLSASGLLALYRLAQVLSERGGYEAAISSVRPFKDVDASMVAATWTQPVALYDLACAVAQHKRLELVQMYSFGCGVDALSVGQVREVLESAGKLGTALKMDEMIDLAAIRIRLRSLAAALGCRSKKPAMLTAPDSAILTASAPAMPPCAIPASPVSPVEPLIIMPALAPYHLATIKRVVTDAGYRLEVLSELNARDIETGLRFCNNDLCHPLIALVGQIMGTLPELGRTRSITLLIPQSCCGCRAIELEQIIRRQLASIGRDNTVEVMGIPSRNDLFTMPAWLATRIYDELAAVDDSGSIGEDAALHPASPSYCSEDIPSRFACRLHYLDEAAIANCSIPPVGVIGTPGLLYTPQLNHDLLGHIEAQGCRPFVPRLTELLTTNAPLECFIDTFVKHGILDIISVQSFGCLTGHINGRGAIKRLKKRYPEVNISFIDFDSGTSEINQQNRLRLALAVLKERAAAR